MTWDEAGGLMGTYIVKSIFFPSKYKIRDCNIKCCNPKIYTGKYIISKGDGA